MVTTIEPRISARSARPALNLSLYLVTDTNVCGEVGVPATVAAAVAGGVSAVQLRDPLATDEELVALGRQVRAALVGTGVPLLVNDRVHLVGTIGADGAHVGQSDLDVAQARALLGPGPYLGLSVQCVEQVQAARAHGLAAVDYLGVGPVWPTATKPDHAPPGGIERLCQVSEASPWPCVAIGGIARERVAALRGTGVVGIAVVSAICGAPDAALAARELARAWEGDWS